MIPEKLVFPNIIDLDITEPRNYNSYNMILPTHLDFSRYNRWNNIYE